ncbi:MAG: ABC transporter permease [Phycisphaerales bacterium]
MPKVLSIARNAFVESTRQPVVLFMVLLCGLLQIFTTWNSGYSLGYQSTESAEVQSDDKVLLDVGMSTVFVMGVLLAGFIATSVISREIESKTMLTVVSKPVSRVSVIIGKYLGVVGALLVSCGLMVLFLMLAIRHGVMTTAADELKYPVLVFSGIALVTSLALAAWLNYFYGWNFPQTGLLLLVPATFLAYCGVLLFNDKWQLQNIFVAFKPQVLTACCALVLAILVLAAVATAASTRLGQVMTIMVCLGVFVASLLSNFMLGRFVFRNEPVGVIRRVEAMDSSKSFTADHSPLVITLEHPVPRPITPGTAIYYGPSPNGFPLHTPTDYGDYKGSLDDPNEMFADASRAPGVIATTALGDKLTLRTVGAHPISIERDPKKGDFVFISPTRTSYPRLAAWGVLPNLQYFWLLDAVSQNRPVPSSYLVTASAYSLVQVTAFLSLAVMLFQRRDVG